MLQPSDHLQQAPQRPVVVGYAPVALQEAAADQTPGSTLTLLSKVFIGFLVVGWFVGLILWPEFAAECLILVVPFVVLLSVWKRLQAHADLDTLIRSFAAGMIPGAGLVLIVESVLAVIFALICFYDQVGDIQDYTKTHPDAPIPKVKRTFGFYVFVALTSYVVAGMTEESMKFIITDENRKRNPWFKDWVGYVLYAAAAACGFSTIENVGYVFMAAKENISGGLENAFERIFVSTPLHVGTALLIGFGIAKKHVFNMPLKTWQIMLVPVLIHGTFDFILLLIYAHQDSIDSTSVLVGSLISSILMLMLLWGLVIREKRAVEMMALTRNIAHAEEPGQVAVV
jgi:RsiW-degrading membrane proteinase PrsW (M82 family)